MEGFKVVEVLNNYKKCPNCGVSSKEKDMCIDVQDDVIHIGCTCGYKLCVDENNKVVKGMSGTIKSVQLCPTCGTKRSYISNKVIAVYIDGIYQDVDFMVCNCNNCKTRFLVDVDSTEME